MLGKPDSYIQKKNQTGLLSHTIYKNKLKMDKKTWMLRPETIKLEENIGNMLFDISLSSFGGDMSLQAKRNKSKNKQIEPHQTKKLLPSKENYQQNKKAAYWMGEDICKWYIQQGISIQNIQRTHTTQHQKKRKKLKVGRGSE